MYDRGEFGKTSTDDGIVNVTHADGEVSIIFGSEADEISALRAEIEGAERSIHIMSFVFRWRNWPRRSASGGARRCQSAGHLREAQQHCELEPVASAALRRRRNAAGWQPLHVHHKVIIIDERTVITGSFNFSGNAARNNDETS